MKLIDREPTQEMIEAMQMDKFHLASYVKALFQAAYDAAPEVEQEPFGYVREIRPGEWKFSKTTSWGPDVWSPVYRFPLDAQAEIAKQAARIAELEAVEEQRDQMIADLYEKRGNDLIKIDEQAAEISRLKGVIAKCKETLVSSISDLQEPNFVTLAAWRVKEAIAAIKEKEK